jgi:hypothetical protein
MGCILAVVHGSTGPDPLMQRNGQVEERDKVFGSIN